MGGRPRDYFYYWVCMSQKGINTAGVGHRVVFVYSVSGAITQACALPVTSYTCHSGSGPCINGRQKPLTGPTHPVKANGSRDETLGRRYNINGDCSLNAGIALFTLCSHIEVPLLWQRLEVSTGISFENNRVRPNPNVMAFARFLLR